MLMKRMRGWRGEPLRVIGKVAGPAPTAPTAAKADDVFTTSGTLVPTFGSYSVVILRVKITARGSAGGVFASGAGDGGGGGGYSFKSVSLTPGQTLVYFVSTTDDNDCFATVAGATVCSARNASGRTGGTAANGVGEVKHSGGDGGSRGNAGGGGGGAGTLAADGTAGVDGSLTGGAGGTPGGGTGANPGLDGGNATQVGAGAGGRVTGGVAGTPGGPEVRISY